jgi:hypothetical protein
VTQLRRYAEGTSVDVETSQLEIKRLVTRHGAQGFMVAEGPRESDGRTVGFVQFQLHGRMVRYEREYPTLAEMKRKTDNHGTKQAQLEARQQQEWRRRWRALSLIIKAKLELVAGGDVTFDREFLADIMLPKGGTVGQVLLPQLAESYRDGTMPRLLPG